MGNRSTLCNKQYAVNKYVGTAYDTVKVVSDNIEDVKTVADALGDDFPEGGFGTIVENIDEVITVSENIDDVKTTADNILEIVEVADNIDAVLDAPNQAELARKWAQEAEDVEVLPNEYSAYHYSKKSEEQAVIAADAADSIGRYQGLWPDTGGIADKGDMYQTQVNGEPTGVYFTALRDTGITPSADNVDWKRELNANDISNTNLLSNHNFLIQTPDGSQPLPSSTPTSYPPGHQIFSGVFANETSGITNLTYIDGRVSFSGGDLYFAVPNTGAIARLSSDQLVASVADFDGKPRTRGVSFALVGDEYRVTVGVDALEDESANETLLGSVKFEQGSVATGHEVGVGVTALNATNQLLPEQRAFYTGKSVWDYADKVTFKPDVNDPSTWNWTPAADAMQAVHSVIYFPRFTANGSQSVYLLDPDYEFIDKIVAGDGYTSVRLECIDASSVVDAAFIFSGRTLPDNIQVGYPESSLTGTEGDGDKIAVLTGKTVANQRVAWGNFKVKFCGTGVASKQSKEDLGLKNTCFSVTFPFVEVENFTFRGWDFDTTSRTGNAYLNIFCQIEDDKKHSAPYSGIEDGIRIAGLENTTHIGQLNVERIQGSRSVNLDGLYGLTGGAIHCEDTILNSNYTGEVRLNNLGGTIGAVSIINKDIVTDGYHCLDCRDMTYDGSGGRSKQTLTVETLHTKRLNRTIGIAGLTDFSFVRRDLASVGTFRLQLDNHTWSSAATDQAVYQSFPIVDNSLELRLNWAFPTVVEEFGVTINNPDTSATVTFSQPQPDTNYKIAMSSNLPRQIFWSNRTVNGFDVNFDATPATVGTIEGVIIRGD